MPKVSIIVPVYKAEQYLHRCVDSILSQSFTDCELILVDDGSPDKSGEICDEYASRDSRIQVIHKQNGGVSSARNAGLDVAHGEYVWFVDSDDWIENDSLKEIYNIMDKTNADICFFELNPITTYTIEKPFSISSIINEHNKVAVYKSKSGCAKAIVNLVMCGGFGWTCNKWFKKSIIDNYILRFDQRFSIQEDHLFTLSYMLYVKSIAIANVRPYYYFINDDSLLKNQHAYLNTKDRNVAIFEIRKAICNKFCITDMNYIKWFCTDYIVREIRNLRSLNKSSLPNKVKTGEIKRCKSLLYVMPYAINSVILKFKILTIMPSKIILKLL